MAKYSPNNIKMDIDIKKIRSLITAGRLSQAFAGLKPIASGHADEVLLLEGQFNRAEKDFRMGIVEHQAHTTQLNKVAHTLLSIISEIEGKQASGNERTENKQETKKMDMDMNEQLNELRSIWNDIRFDASVSHELKGDLGHVIRGVEEYIKGSVDPLYDADGRLWAMVESMAQGFYHSHSLELKKRGKVEVAKLKSFVIACENAPTAFNGEQLANALWVFDRQYDFRQRFADVSHSHSAMGKVMGEMADVVEGLWEKAKTD